MSELNPTKSAFSKPENWVTWFFTAGLIGGVGYVLYNLLPYAINIADNLLYLAAVGIPLAIIGFVLTSADVHKLAWYGWKSAIRWLTGRFVELDPIGIMRTGLEKYDEILAAVSSGMSSMRAQLKNILKSIRENEQAAEHCLALASQAKALIGSDPTLQSKAALEARKAERFKETNIKYKNMQAMLEKALSVAEKMFEKATYNREDLKTTIDIKSNEREAIKATYKSMSGFKRLLQSDKELEMFNLGLEAENNFEFQKIGEIEQFWDETKDLMLSDSLEKLASESESLTKLDEWEKKSAERTARNVRISPNLSPNLRLPTSAGSFDDLLELDNSNDFTLNNKTLKK